MRLEIKIDGDLNALMRGEVLAGQRAVSAAINAAGTALKSDWRAQIMGAGLGRRLSNTIRANVYPKGKPSLNAAALVYTKAPQIISAHETGAVIRSRNGFWLAIPLPQAGKLVGGARITPAQWERKTGRLLQFVYRKGRSALLVDTGTKGHGNVFGKNRRGELSAPRTFKNRSVPMFVLVPQVRLKKRLNLLAAAEPVQSAVPAAIVANWRVTR